MNAVMSKPRAVVSSRILMAYALTKPQQKLIERFEQLRAYMELAGKRPPCIRLKRADWIDLDASIRKQSDGQFGLADIRYHDFPILSASE